jgi:hypothetical protein
MRIEYEDVFDVLAEAVTDFKPSEAELEDRLSYPFLNGMVRFVCNRPCASLPTSLKD